MSKQLKQVINLSKKTGDRIIVFDNSAPEDSFVLMTLDQYEGLLGEKLETKEIEKPQEELKKTEEKKEVLAKIDEKPMSVVKEVEREVKFIPEEPDEIKNSFDEEIAKRDAQIIKDKKSQESSSVFGAEQFDNSKKGNIIDGPLKETLRNLLTEKKIVDKIDSIEKNNANLNGNRPNNWRIPPEVKEDSE